MDKAYGVAQGEMALEQYMGKFQVPFVIWANYPLPQDGPEVTSLNFLGQHVLRYAGIESSLYGNFLWQMQQACPHCPSRDIGMPGERHTVIWRTTGTPL